MRTTPEELTAQGYVLLDKLEHNELIPFVKTYLGKRTALSITFTAINCVVAAALGFCFWNGYGQEDFNLGDGITHFSYGLAFALGLIPVHEYIHVLAYRSQGAEHTSYDSNIRKFYFMALADRFVANKREFTVVALAPFVVVTAVCGILLLLVDQLWAFTVLGTLLTHTACSSGDFGILNYFHFHKEMEIVTYDDTVNKISYFYGKKVVG
jgi:hypothetical protein